MFFPKWFKRTSRILWLLTVLKVSGYLLATINDEVGAIIILAILIGGMAWLITFKLIDYILEFIKDNLEKTSTSIRLLIPFGISILTVVLAIHFKWYKIYLPETKDIPFLMHFWDFNFLIFFFIGFLQLTEIFKTNETDTKPSFNQILRGLVLIISSLALLTLIIPYILGIPWVVEFKILPWFLFFITLGFYLSILLPISMFIQGARCFTLYAKQVNIKNRVSIVDKLSRIPLSFIFITLTWTIAHYILMTAFMDHSYSGSSGKGGSTSFVYLTGGELPEFLVPLIPIFVIFISAVLFRVAGSLIAEFIVPVKNNTENKEEDNSGLPFLYRIAGINKKAIASNSEKRLTNHSIVALLSMIGLFFISFISQMIFKYIDIPDLVF